MKIQEVMDYATKNSIENLNFFFNNHDGTLYRCQVVDSYLGFFSIEGKSNLISANIWKEKTNDYYDFRLEE